jgi:hypothetical protein
MLAHRKDIEAKLVGKHGFLYEVNHPLLWGNVAEVGEGA